MAAHAQQAENRNTGPYINKTNCPKRATARPTKTTDPAVKRKYTRYLCIVLVASSPKSDEATFVTAEEIEKMFRKLSLQQCLKSQKCLITN